MKTMGCKSYEEMRRTAGNAQSLLATNLRIGQKEEDEDNEGGAGEEEGGDDEQ